MLISLVEYAKKHDKDPAVLRRYAEQGKLQTAYKLGRNWVLDSFEPYPVIKRDRPQKIKVVSLFSGCGGMDLGFLGGFEFLGKKFKKLPYEIIWANELNPSACKTYRTNFKHDIVEGDIYQHMHELPEKADVVIGGFPCQDISINGKMVGIKGKRSGLYTAIVETVRKVRPKAFVAENVGGLLLKKHEASLAKIISDFKELGYRVSYHLYKAEEYGVPQTRNRVFIIGLREDLPEFVPPDPRQDEVITAREALQDLEKMPSNKEFAHIWSKANVSGEQGNRRLIADRPGYTIRAECHGNIQFHYNQNRRMSMREAARIQSFPDSFAFPCGLRETERQIGNAVPPVLAWNVARALLRSLTS